mgnify:CR=1 FL=1
MLFRSEATSSTDPSTVHGAYTSGVNAANQVALLSKEMKNTVKKNDIDTDLPLENGTPNIPKLGESNGNSQLYRRI